MLCGVLAGAADHMSRVAASRLKVSLMKSELDVSDLAVIREAYAEGVPLWLPVTNVLREATIRNQILGAPSEFPLWLVKEAELGAFRAATRRIVPVGKLASDRGWVTTLVNHQSSRI